MSFQEERVGLAGELTALHNLIRQALDAAETVADHANAVVDRTETFADDTVLAKVAQVAKRSRQDLSSLSRAVTEARESLSSH